MTKLNLINKHWLNIQCSKCRHDKNVPVQQFLDRGINDIQQIKAKPRCSHCGHRGEQRGFALETFKTSKEKKPRPKARQVMCDDWELASRHTTKRPNGCPGRAERKGNENWAYHFQF